MMLYHSLAMFAFLRARTLRSAWPIGSSIRLLVLSISLTLPHGVAKGSPVEVVSNGLGVLSLSQQELDATQDSESVVPNDPLPQSDADKSAETEEPEAKEPEAKEPEAKESDAKEPEAKQSDAKESEAKESDAKESDAKESEAKESDAKESEAKESEVGTPEPDAPPIVKPPPSSNPPNEGTPPVEKRIIGATATVLEKTSGFLFRCRVDTGAKSCALHVEKWVIENEDKEKMSNNYGKLVRILVKNNKGNEHWITSKIAHHVIIKNAAATERRYKVPLILRWKDCEKTVLVTLDDRSDMDHPMLLGRNFLSGDFLVDVDLESSD